MSTDLKRVSLEIDGELAKMMARLRTIPRGSIPRPIHSFLDDLCRDEPRTVHPMGAYPKVAYAVAAVPEKVRPAFHVVTAPMAHLKSRIWNDHYATALPCLMEVTARETEANNALNHCQHRVLKSPYDDVLDSAIEQAEVQIAETRYYKAVLVQMKYERRRVS